jgi:hypothetical protein
VAQNTKAAVTGAPREHTDLDRITPQAAAENRRMIRGANESAAQAPSPPSCVGPGPALSPRTALS